MIVISTNTTTGLRPFTFENGEQIKFMINTKGGGGSYVWFDKRYPAIRKIYFGGLRLECLGKMDKKTEDAVVKMMILGKTDVLTDGQYHYTRTSMGWTKILNLNQFCMINPYLIN